MTIKDKEQLTEALKTVQRLYMKRKNKTNCVGFYVSLIQPIYKEFEANEADKDHEPSINYDGVLDAVNCVGCGSELTEQEKPPCL